jgi:hypothetical protein
LRTPNVNKAVRRFISLRNKKRKGTAEFLFSAFSLHRSQISEDFDLEDYLIDSGSGSRIGEAAGASA